MNSIPITNSHTNTNINESVTVLSKEEDVIQIISRVFDKYFKKATPDSRPKRSKIPMIVKDYVQELVITEHKEGHIKTISKIKESIKEIYNVSIGISTIQLLLRRYRNEIKQKHNDNNDDCNKPETEMKEAETKEAEMKEAEMKEAEIKETEIKAIGNNEKEDSNNLSNSDDAIDINKPYYLI